MHRFARKAAAAALAAESMGKFWEFHEALYENNNELNIEKVREIAAGMGLDPDVFEKEMNSEKIQNRIDKDIMDAEKAEVRGTPTVFINGRLLRDRSLEGFQEMIDAQLKKKK